MINIVAFLGPSGSGKTTLRNELKMLKIVTYTSRKPRKGEIEGIHYFFTTKENIVDMYEKGELLEYTQYHDYLYATSMKTISYIVESGETASIIVDKNGAKKLKEKFGDSVLVVGVTAPAIQCVRRMQERNEPEIERRLSSYEMEVKLANKYCDVIINNAEENWERSKLLVKVIESGLSSLDD
ncbi:MAG: AAA family ATPase [Gudongella sp.]|jgi:guanylate kinase|nr:AAA family ATPase [Gudongella sp.]